MYRVSITEDATRPSRVVYQAESKEDALVYFYDNAEAEASSCVEMFIWITHEGDKRGAWKTSRLYKRYR